MAMPETGRAANETRLSLWGMGVPRQDGLVGGLAARLNGVLSQLGGCLVVTAGNGFRVQPVFPAGKAQWNQAAGTLTLSGKDYRLGDRITLGGGGVTSPSGYRREAGVEIAACEVSDLWAVIA